MCLGRHFSKFPLVLCAQVHLQENVGEIDVQSGGGDIEIAVTPQSRVRVVVEGASDIDCSDTGVCCVLCGADSLDPLDIQPDQLCLSDRTTHCALFFPFALQRCNKTSRALPSSICSPSLNRRPREGA